jgi:hypothetical protein
MNQLDRSRRTGQAMHFSEGGWRLTREDAWDPSIRVDHSNRRQTMRGVLLWAVGIPIPVIILLYLFHVI